MDEQLLGLAQGGGQTPLAAANVDDQAAGEVALLEYLPGGGGGRILCKCTTRGDEHEADGEQGVVAIPIDRAMELVVVELSRPKAAEDRDE